MNTQLSVALIVRNNEDTLNECLSSIKSFADEIIIVDTGSTDKTKEIASKHTPFLFDFSWCDDFSAARNYALKKCTRDYRMMIDSDDFVSKSEALKLKQLKKSFHLYDMIQIKYRYGDNGNSQVRKTITVNSKDSYFYKYPIHEYIEIPADSKIEYFGNISIDHIVKSGLQQEESSLTRNLKISMINLFNSKFNDDPYLLAIAAREAYLNGNNPRISRIFLEQAYYNEGQSSFWKLWSSLFLGELAERRKDLQEAFKWREISIAENPKHPQPLYEMGRLSLLHKPLPNVSIGYFKQALEQNFDQELLREDLRGRIYDNLAIAYYKCREYELAIDASNLAINEFQKLGPVYKTSIIQISDNIEKYYEPAIKENQLESIIELDIAKTQSKNLRTLKEELYQNKKANISWTYYQPILSEEFKHLNEYKDRYQKDSLSRYAKIENYLKQKRILLNTVYDFGCNYGYFCYKLSTEYNDSTFVGVEYIKEISDFNKKVVKEIGNDRISFVEATIDLDYVLKIPNNCDLAIYLSIHHHLNNEQREQILHVLSLKFKNLIFESFPQYNKEYLEQFYDNPKGFYESDTVFSYGIQKRILYMCQTRAKSSQLDKALHAFIMNEYRSKHLSKVDREYLNFIKVQNATIPASISLNLLSKIFRITRAEYGFPRLKDINTSLVKKQPLEELISQYEIRLINDTFWRDYTEKGNLETLNISMIENLSNDEKERIFKSTKTSTYKDLIFIQEPKSKVLTLMEGHHRLVDAFIKYKKGKKIQISGWILTSDGFRNHTFNNSDFNQNPLLLKLPKNFPELDFNILRENRHGWFDQNDTNEFRSIIKESTKSYLNIVEIGAWMGRGTTKISELLEEHKLGSILYSIDTFEGSIEHNKSDQYNEILPKLYNQYLSNIYHKDAVRNTRVIRGSSTEIVNQFPDNFADCIYIDAAHDYESVKRDIELWLPKLTDNGILCGDDYPDWPGVKKAVDELAKEKGYKVYNTGKFWKYQK
jgi:glycosyltransferase involved in cell wall biosynthesis